jgi:hypothetical protein
LKTSYPFALLAITSALLLGAVPASAESIVIQDSLKGTTKGVRVGGTLTSEGYKPGKGSGHILYKSPRQVKNGYIQFEMKGFVPSLIQDPVSPSGDGDNGFFGMYDGRGIREPIKYANDFKYNYFRWNFHYRVNRKAFKSVISCAKPTTARLNSTRAVFSGGGSLRDWFTEPTGRGYSFNSTSWYTVKCVWKSKTFKVMINGTTVWSASGPYDYAPIDFKIWLGSAPGYGDKYIQMVPNIIFRNFKLVSY